MSVVYLIERRLELLQPSFRSRVESLLVDLALKRVNLAVFETYRHPERQAHLTDDVTKAPPWRSAHQYGLAVDFARPLGKSGFSWEVSRADWDALAELAYSNGLRVPYPSWDPGHVEDPAFGRIRPMIPVHA